MTTRTLLALGIQTTVGTLTGVPGSRCMPEQLILDLYNFHHVNLLLTAKEVKIQHTLRVTDQIS